MLTRFSFLKLGFGQHFTTDTGNQATRDEGPGQTRTLIHSTGTPDK